MKKSSPGDFGQYNYVDAPNAALFAADRGDAVAPVEEKELVQAEIDL
jgi:hypothetical protein